MVESWTELQNFHKNRQAAADAVEKIRSECAEKHAKSHVSECKDCYGDVVDVLKSRFQNPNSPQANEWFTHRGNFLRELDGLFTSLKEHGTDPKTIEVRAEEEKAGWYRYSLRTSAVGSVAETSMGKSNFIGALADKSLPTHALIDEIRRALDKGTDEPVNLEEFMKQFPEDLPSEARAELHIDIFFRDPKTGQIPPNCIRYVEKLRSGVSLEMVMATIDADRVTSAQALVQMEKKKRRLDELKRAQTAHAQDKIRKAKRRQQGPGEPLVPKEMYDLPACSVCSGVVDPQNVYSCSMCHILSVAKAGEKTVYCSAECYEKGNEDHVKNAHGCASAESCVQLHEEDIDMAGNDSAVVCQECIKDLRQPTIYCSFRCAGANFQKHREDVHIPGRKKLETDPEEDGTKLVFDNEEKTKYHVEHMDSVTWPLDEALDIYFTSKNPDIKLLPVA